MSRRRSSWLGGSWDDAKNANPRAECSIGFEDIVFHIERGDLLDILEDPNPDHYADQRIFVRREEEYAYLMPFPPAASRLPLAARRTGAVPSRRRHSSWSDFGVWAHDGQPLDWRAQPSLGFNVKRSTSISTFVAPAGVTLRRGDAANVLGAARVRHRSVWCQRELVARAVGLDAFSTLDSRRLGPGVCDRHPSLAVGVAIHPKSAWCGRSRRMVAAVRAGRRAGTRFVAGVHHVVALISLVTRPGAGPCASRSAPGPTRRAPPARRSG